MANGAWAVQTQAEQQQRHRDDERGPDDQRESVGRRRGRAPGDDVADAPRQRGRDAQQQRQQRDVAAASDADDHQADAGDEDPDDLPRGRPLSQPCGRDDHGEDHLGLQHQRREPRRHPEVHRAVEQAELAQRHEHPDRHDGLPRRRRTRDQEHGRQDDDGEPQRDEEQRRYVVHPPLDHHEVETPDSRDQRGEQRVAQIHGPSLRCVIMKHQRLVLHRNR